MDGLSELVSSTASACHRFQKVEGPSTTSAQIDRVVLTPSPARAGLGAGLHGELAGVQAVCKGAARMSKAQTHERPGSFEPGR